LNLEKDTVLFYASPDTKEAPLTLEKYLNALVAQGYLEKTRVKPPANNANTETELYEWRWGNREVEFSEKSAAIFIDQM
jgi:hypothetical protein